MWEQSQRRVTSPTCTSKMFRQHLKCSLTAPRRAGTSFFCFFLLSQLSEPGRLGTALSGRASRLASAMTFSGCDTSPTVDCCSFSICRTQSPEELGRVGERSLRWTARLSCGDTDFFFLMLTRGRGLGERGDKILRVTVTAPTTMHAEERQHECSQRHSEVRAGRLSGRFRLRAYRTVQTRPVSSRSVYHGIFPDVYFYTHSLQRPHERRPMASRREQVSALFFVAWTQRRLTECFPWATEGPNPSKETLTFKKEFFWQTTSGSLPAGLNSRDPTKQQERTGAMSFFTSSSKTIKRSSSRRSSKQRTRARYT